MRLRQAHHEIRRDLMKRFARSEKEVAFAFENDFRGQNVYFLSTASVALLSFATHELTCSFIELS